MRPAFRSIHQLATFLALLFLTLTLPITLSWFHIPSQAQIYEQANPNVGPFPFFRHQIFEEKGDIDLLFVGPSLLWVAVDTQYLQAALSRKLDRPATVLTLGTNWRGEDLYYRLFKDMVSRRRVKTLVITMPNYYQLADEPHSHAYLWMAFGQDSELMAQMSIKQRIRLYAMNVLGAPRHALNLLRPNITEPFDLHSSEEETLGALLVRQGYKGDPFKEVDSTPPSIPAEEMIYQTASKKSFRFSGPALGPYQLGVNRALVSLAHQNGVQVVILNVPLASKREDSVVDERMNWPEVLGQEIQMVGIPPSRLFKGMSDEQVLLHYYDDHLNINGNRYFTRAVAPALLRLYEQANTRLH